MDYSFVHFWGSSSTFIIKKKKRTILLWNNRRTHYVICINFYRNMSIEIERKYLVKQPLIEEIISNIEGDKIIQGYLSLNQKRAVRIRVKNGTGILTIKGESKGIQRKEFEYEIPLSDAEEMLDMCTHQAISKTRYTVTIENKNWEIDVFENQNRGLIIAEIELEDESENVCLPKWIEREVSDDTKFYNLSLYLNPFSTWK